MLSNAVKMPDNESRRKRRDSRYCQYPYYLKGLKSGESSGFHKDQLRVPKIDFCESAAELPFPLTVKKVKETSKQTNKDNPQTPAC